MCSRCQPGYSILIDSDGQIVQVRINPPNGYETEKDARPTNLAPVLLEYAGDRISTIAKCPFSASSAFDSEKALLPCTCSGSVHT
jgi:hypothetical protein